MPPLFLKGLAVAGLVVVLDQLSKWWIVTDVMNPPHTLEITSFFNIVLTHNRGVSFGMFAAGSPSEKWALVGVAVAISLFLLRWLWKEQLLLSGLALGLIVGGAVGNVIDRIRIGAVVDFLDFHAYGTHWPAFNVADAAIFVGVAFLVLESFLVKDKPL